MDGWTNRQIDGGVGSKEGRERLTFPRRPYKIKDKNSSNQPSEVLFKTSHSMLNKETIDIFISKEARWKINLYFVLPK